LASRILSSNPQGSCAKVGKLIPRNKIKKVKK